MRKLIVALLAALPPIAVAETCDVRSISKYGCWPEPQFDELN